MSESSEYHGAIPLNSGRGRAERIAETYDELTIVCTDGVACLYGSEEAVGNFVDDIGAPVMSYEEAQNFDGDAGRIGAAREVFGEFFEGPEQSLEPGQPITDGGISMRRRAAETDEETEDPDDPDEQSDFERYGIVP